MDLVSSKWKRITLGFFHFIVFLIFELENLLKKGLGRVNLLKMIIDLRLILLSEKFSAICPTSYTVLLNLMLKS